MSPPSADSLALPPVHEDAAWDLRARAAAPSDRGALLARADALREGDAADRAVAARIYRALQSEIDVESPTGVERLRCVVEHLEWLHPDAAPLVARAADACRDEKVQMRALALHARFLGAAGEAAEARRVLRTLVSWTRGSGTREECSACFNLAWHAQDGDEPLTALAYARRAIELMPSVGDARGLGLAHLARARVFAAIGDGERFAVEAAAVEAIVAELAPPDANHLQFAFALLRASAAIASRRVADARAALAECVEREPEIREQPGRGRAFLHLEGLVALAEGRVDEADRALERAAHGDPDAMCEDIDVAFSRLQVQAIRRGFPSTAAEAERILDAYVARGRSALSPDTRARRFSDVAAWLDVACADVGVRARAWDLATEAVLDAVARTERELEELDDLLHAHADDLIAVREYAARADLTRESVVQAAGRAWKQEFARGGDGLLQRLSDAPDRVLLCAWCARMRVADGRWLPLAMYVPVEGPGQLTHGICETCERSVRGSATPRLTG